MILLLGACMHTPTKTVTDGPGPWRVELEAGSVQSAEGPVEIRMRVHNTGDEPATFCRYHTPFEGIQNDIFIVERGGRVVDYRGMMKKRAPPGPKDHTTVRQGAHTAWATVDLTDGYPLQQGSYTVRYRGTGISGLPDSPAVTITLE